MLGEANSIFSINSFLMRERTISITQTHFYEITVSKSNRKGDSRVSKNSLENSSSQVAQNFASLRINLYPEMKKVANG